MDYLLNQTGQPLQSVDTDSEQTDQLLEEVNVDEEDEGFEEDVNEDPTMSFLFEDEAEWNPPTVQPAPAFSMSAASSEPAVSQAAADDSSQPAASLQPAISQSAAAVSSEPAISQSAAAVSFEPAISQPAAPFQTAPGSPPQEPEELLVCTFHNMNFPSAEMIL